MRMVLFVNLIYAIILSCTSKGGTKVRTTIEMGELFGSCDELEDPIVCQKCANETEGELDCTDCPVQNYGSTPIDESRPPQDTKDPRVIVIEIDKPDDIAQLPADTEIVLGEEISIL